MGVQERAINFARSLVNRDNKQKRMIHHEYTMNELYVVMNSGYGECSGVTTDLETKGRIESSENILTYIVN